MISGHRSDSEPMPGLKRIVSVAAVALFVILGAAPTAGAGVSAESFGSTASGTPPSTPPAEDGTGDLSAAAGERLPLPSPAPPPARPEDAPPDGGAPGWLWIVVALLAGAGMSVAVLLWRGSRPPGDSVPVLENTAELVAVGRRQAPGVGRNVDGVR